MYSFSKFLLVGLLAGTALSPTDNTAQAFDVNQSVKCQGHRLTRQSGCRVV